VPSFSGVRDIVLFTLGEFPCALPVEEVAEVLPMCWLERQPGLPLWHRGVFRLGQEGIAVVCMRRLLGMESEALSLYSPLLVLRRPEARAALLVDQVRGIARVDAAHVESGLFGPLPSCRARVAGETVHVLDIVPVLDGIEDARSAASGSSSAGGEPSPPECDGTPGVLHSAVGGQS